MLYRGFLFRQLYRRARLGFWVSALVPSVVFAVAHLYQSDDLMELLGIVAITGIGSIGFCWLFIKWRDNIWPIFGLHAGMNLWWEVFAVDDTGLGGWVANGARLATIIVAVLLTIYKDKIWKRLPSEVVIAMGRFGGHELGYGSDADVLFVHEPREGVGDQEAAKAANRVVSEMRRLLALPSADPPLLIDADLRPEGKSGPLVRTLKSYEAYYRRWSLVWESQALLRAEPVAGDLDLGRRFIDLIDPLRFPAEGLGEDAVREIRRLKARMESERLPRGADPTLHTKLGRGGLSDVEWTVQLLQLQHGWAEPGLRTTRTRQALAAACAAELIPGEEAAILDEAWILASRVRGAVMLVRGRPGDTFPSDGRELAAVGRYLGYDPGHVGDMLEDYRRLTRRARAVMEERFYGA